MRALLIAAALALAAPCAFAQEPGTTSPRTSIQNGQTVEAEQGGKFMLQLGVNPSTGERWDVARKPDFLGAATIIVTPAPGQPLGPAAPQMATISFDVMGAGTGVVVLEMHGPAPGSAPLASFRVTVAAH